MCWNQVEKEKKRLRKRVGERKREGDSGIKWKVEKNKERGWRYMGIRVWWRKIKRKKKRKRKEKKRNLWMIERNKRKKKVTI